RYFVYFRSYTKSANTLFLWRLCLLAMQRTLRWMLGSGRDRNDSHNLVLITIRMEGYAQARRSMELRHLRYFVAVADTLSFTKGAEKLHLSQPSLTRQIKDLEEEIDVRLIDRAKPHVTLTREGTSFL